MSLNRRNFLKALGAATAVAAAPGVLSATGGQHVVVIGGGFGGATVAKYIRMWSNYTVDVTLVDPKAHHTSCIMSNLVLNGSLNLRDLRFTYLALADKYGINVIQDSADDIDGASQRVMLRAGGWINYDKLVLATGIGFDNVDGWDPDLMPHAWIAGAQTTLLKEQINAIPQRGTFIMTVPKSPYRCPPGPYERACVVADMLDRNGGGKVIVLDENSAIQAERETFTRAYNELYGSVVEYVPNAEIRAVDPVQKAIETSAGTYVGDVVNLIPRQRAAGLVSTSGVTGGERWAPVDPLTYESTLASFSGVYIIGDAQGTGQPKSGHMANSQAKICADAIVRTLSGQSALSAERISNITTNSACYSPVSSDEASWLTAVFGYDAASGQMKLNHVAEADSWSREHYNDMFGWSKNLFMDTFG